MTAPTLKSKSPELAKKILEDVQAHSPYEWAEDDLGDAARYALQCMAELQRYREREPLVQALLKVSADTACSWWDCKDAAEAVRDFKLSASAAEGDESA